MKREEVWRRGGSKFDPAGGRRMTGSAFQRWTLPLQFFFFNRREFEGGWGSVGPGAEAGG